MLFFYENCHFSVKNGKSLWKYGLFSIKCAYFGDLTTLELFLEHELFLTGSTNWFKSLILSLPAVHSKSADLFFYSLIA